MRRIALAGCRIVLPSIPCGGRSERRTRKMTGPVVILDGLGFSYRPGEWIVRGYNATIEKGQVFAMLGPNGRGKTTLLKLLLGMLSPVEGRLKVVGQVGFAPQLLQIAFDYTALDMVLMGRARKIGLFGQPGKADKEIALAALDRFGLANLAHRRFHEMSGGQRQLLVFARALVAEADILILDEPTSALDLKNQIVLMEWIAKLSSEDGLTILMTTHQPHHALAVADQALLMLSEQEYVCGSTADVLTERNLLALYGAPIKRVSFDVDGRQVESFAPIFAPKPQSRSGSR
jgi:iron complex transport system ATP-binding protein